MKAFLTWHETISAKTHQLIPLLMDANKINKDFGKLRDAAVSLSPYAVLYRYPGEALEPTKTEAAKAITDAKLFMEIVKKSSHGDNSLNNFK